MQAVQQVQYLGAQQSFFYLDFFFSSNVLTSLYIVPCNKHLFSLFSLADRRENKAN